MIGINLGSFSNYGWARSYPRRRVLSADVCQLPTPSLCPELTEMQIYEYNKNKAVLRFFENAQCFHPAAQYLLPFYML